MKYRNLYLYNKLQVLKKDIKRVLTEEIETTVKSPIVKRKTGESLDDKLSIIINYGKLSKGTILQENDIVIKELDNLLTESTKKSSEVKYKVSSILVNLTKLMNEIKPFVDSDMTLEMAETRDSMQRISSLYNVIDNEYQHIRERKKAFDDKAYLLQAKNAMEDELSNKLMRYQSKIEKELMLKYNLTPEDINYVSSTPNVLETSKTELQKKLKKLIRQVKEYMIAYSDIDQNLIDNTTIYVKGLRALLSISKTQKGTYNMSQEGFEVIHQNKELFEKLEKYITFDESSEKVGKASETKFQLATYYSEHKAKIETELQSLDDIKAELNESVGSMLKGAISAITTKFKLVMNKVNSIMDTFVNSVTKDMSVTTNELTQQYTTERKKVNKLATDMSKLIIDAKKVELETLKNTIKN